MVLGGPLIALAARRLRLDVVHDPIGISPFTLGRWAGRFARVVTIHDAIAHRFPQGYPWLNTVLHQRYVPLSLPNVDAVITHSEFSRRDLGRYLGLSPERCHVVPLAAGPKFHPVSPGEAQRAAARYGLTGPFVLSVGAQQARKNIGRLLEAFALLRPHLPDVRLAIAGPTLWRHDGLQQHLRALRVTDAVRLLGFVSDADLPALYSAASVFVLPSLLEGFGLPVLEAMACGTPVVCSKTGSLPEVAGDAALLVDPYDSQGLSEAMEHVLRQPAVASSLCERGLERARQFTWEKTARETVRVYRETLAGGGRSAKSF